MKCADGITTCPEPENFGCKTGTRLCMDGTMPGPRPWFLEAIRVAGDAAEAHISDRPHTFDREPTGWRVCRCGAIDKDGSHRTAMVIEELYYAGYLVDPADGYER